MRIQTPRLILRDWRDSDLGPFAAMNADPEVMRFFPSTLDRAASEAAFARVGTAIEQRGFGLWAAELRETGSFIGFIGLAIPSFEAHFTPCIEIGWRLAAAYHNRGLATEGAKAVLKDGFERVGLTEIVSFTTQTNLPSRRVMEKIGMRRDPADDFDHPGIEAGHPMRRHVLYRARPRG